MKNTLSIIALGIALMTVQACGSKSEKTTEEVAAADAPVAKKVALTPAERKAKIENERIRIAKRSAEQAEKRRVAFEELVAAKPTYQDAKGNIVYNKAEVQPSYTGGEKAMMEYFRSNIKFPKEAEENGDEATVFVDFVVDADGSVREVEVTDVSDEETNQSFRDEAIRVVSAMPKWTPGRQHGQPVHVKYSLPIAFQMM